MPPQPRTPRVPIDEGVRRPTSRRRWCEEDIRALGVTTDLVTAGQILGMGRTKGHELARAGAFPVPVLQHGRRYVVPVVGLLRVLGYSVTSDTATLDDGLDLRPESSIHQR